AGELPVQALDRRRPALHPRGFGPAGARLREPALQRRALLARRARLDPRARGLGEGGHQGGGPRTRDGRAGEGPDLRGVLSRGGHRLPPRRRSRPGDRQGVRRGQRRPGLGRVAAGTGHRLRGGVSTRGWSLRRGTGSGRTGREMSQRVLVCDDEMQIRRALRVVLRDAGFEVIETADAREALDAASVNPPDAAIIDLLLPDGDGVDVTRSIRTWSDMPILVLSAVGEEEQKVRPLEAGADDDVTKPFGPNELIARLRAALRRAGDSADQPTIVADDLEIDRAGHTVRRDGDEIHLTPIEFKLLQTLAANRGRL